jgi:hypothetical protein
VKYGTYDLRALVKLVKSGWKEVGEGKEEGEEGEKRWWDAAWRAEGFRKEMRVTVERLGRRL